MPAPMPPKISHQYSTKNSDIAMTSSVGVGRSAPKDEKICLNDGITKIMITATTMKATTSTATG